MNSNIIYYNLFFLSTLYILVSSHCTNTHFHCFESGQRAADCNDRISWIWLSELCNGKLDCPNGEDETKFVCKKHSKFNYKQNFFTCATGALIDNKFRCNKVNFDCSDNSDELNCEYNQLDVNKLRGNCRESEIECLPGECEDQSKICDGRHDCTNGRDESLEICIANCTLNEFQCGNGKCLSSELLCDGKYDCPDGADELPIVCNNKLTLDQLGIPKTCEKPVSIEFANMVKTYQNRTNGNIYVLPNTPVKFECPITMSLIGLKWNVCKPNGEWSHPLPKCINRSAKNGCPLPQLYLERPKIYKCQNSEMSSCDMSIEVIPPINYMFVHFKCNEGYKIVPEILETRSISCVNAKWDSLIKPKCQKV